MYDGRPDPRAQPAAVRPPAEAPRVRLAPRHAAGLAGGVLVVGLTTVAAWGTGYHFADVPVAAAATSEPSVIPAASSEAPAEVRRLRQRRRQLENRLARTEPRGRYIVIDQTHNRLYLKEDDKTLLEADCSAGSGMVLKESEGGRGRTWVFDTPRGRFRVLSKITNPVWRKPDWAFVEEGVPIPRNPADRLEYGTLGEYALYFGDGFLIHGTLYERLLGRSVSHGCIRLGRDDLRQLYRAARVGTPIYIY